MQSEQILIKKNCIKCNTEKDINEFHKNSKLPDGYKYYCRDCCKTGNKFYYQKDKINRLQQMKKRSNELKLDKIVIYYKSVDNLVSQFIEKLKEISDNSSKNNNLIKLLLNNSNN